MATDVFNNPSNDYVNPGLAPCAGAGDGDATFEFVDNGAGIISGSNILQFMDLSNISVLVNSWINQKITLQSGEVTYVPGLEKGLLQKRQVFDLPSEEWYEPENAKYFMILDLSINHYYNFRYYHSAVDASGDLDRNIDIDDAMNIALSEQNINATLTWDSSTFTFLGNTVGYDFDITSAWLTISNVSEGNPFPEYMRGYSAKLGENPDGALPSSKYPNGAMLGYVLKAKYPSAECPVNSWIYMNHVESPFDVYIPLELTFESDISIHKTLTFDPCIADWWSEIVDDIDVSIADITTTDISIGDFTYIATDASTDVSTGITIDGSIVDWRNIYASIITDSTISNSNIYDDTSISGSYLELDFILGGTITDSSILTSGVSGASIINSYINPSQIEYCDVSLSTATSTLFVNSNLFGVTISDSSIKNGFIGDSSGLTYPVTDASLETYYAFNGNLFGNPGNTATWNIGSPAYVTGVYNQALSIDNSVSYVSLDYSPSASDKDLTITFFIKLDDDPSAFNSGVIWNDANDDDPNVATDSAQLTFSNGVLNLYLQNRSTDATYPIKNIQDNEWHFIVVSYEEDNIEWKVYVDDINAPYWSDITIDTSMLASDHSSHFLGGGTNGVTQPADIDEYRIYKKLLTRNELLGLKTNGESFTVSSAISNSFVENVIIEDASLVDLYIKDSSIVNSNITGGEFYDIKFENGTITNVQITGDTSTTIIYNAWITDSSIQNAVIFDSSIGDGTIKDSSISGGTIWNVIVEDSFIDTALGTNVTANNVTYAGTILYDSYLKDSVIYDTHVEDSSMLRVIFSVDSSLINCDIEDVKVNMVNVTGSDIWIYDPSSERMEIFGGKIHDSSIYNTTIYDASIYLSVIEDCSLYGCTIYNTQFGGTVDTSACINYKINSTCSYYASIILDTSVYYDKVSKIVNVGMNGCGDNTTLSGADYLDYINTHDLWFKVGPFASRISAPDVLNSAEKNLIGGFYLFNPQTFPVQVEYMLINYNES